MKKLNFKLLILAVALFCLPTLGSAEVEKMDNIIEGSIVSVSTELITVLKKLDGELRISEIKFSLNPETKFKEFESISELKEGDKVAVTYTEDEDKVAILVTKMMAAPSLDQLSE